VDESLSLVELFAELRVARQPAKPSPHTERAARADFTALHAHLHETLGSDVVTLDEVTPRALRLAFAAFAAGHSAASIARAWSTWNQFFAFLVAEDHLPGNPMGAVARPKSPRRTPKPLQGEDAPELLLLPPPPAPAPDRPILTERLRRRLDRRVFRRGPAPESVRVHVGGPHPAFARAVASRQGHWC
jgi:site-specific recombinase XerC